ncbi:MCM1 [Candida jiufengensis]|uniref:MCM1 n=1 Tax=Candida jiufengensis TaxID=497108 RepID=UPI002224A86A|nr:MCM1 [Candida jiufengensis]KAI5949576.1 MCM1 [Candida jiufengensis]
MSAKLEDGNEYDQGSNGPNQINSATLSNPPDDDDDEDGPSTGKTQKERRKIEIKFIQDKSRRHITFSKRKAGIMKKAYELSVLTGTQVLLLVVSETGLVYTFTTPKLQPLVTKPEGKNLIQACLNAPEEGLDNEQGDQSDGENAESPEQSPVPVQQQPQSQPQQQQQPQQHLHQQQQQQQQAHLQHQQNAAAAAAAQHAQQQHQQVQQGGQSQQHPQMQPLPGQPHGLPPHYGNQQQQQPGQGQGNQQQVPYGDYAYFSNMQNNNIPNQQQYQ